MKAFLAAIWTNVIKPRLPKDFISWLFSLLLLLICCVMFRVVLLNHSVVFGSRVLCLSGSSSGSLPLGTIIPFFGYDVPVGFQMCNGDPVKDEYPSLRDHLLRVNADCRNRDGKVCVPDLRGSFLRGIDDRTDRTGKDKQQNRKIGSTQVASLARHKHLFTNQKSECGYIGIKRYTMKANDGTNFGIAVTFTDDPNTQFNEVKEEEDETRPYNIAVSYIIKALP